MAQSRFLSVFSLLAILLLIAGLAPARRVAAQGGDAAELIRLVNELRASEGLEPYTVDPGLMALAQEHSEYQASISTSTHQHSDGRVPPQLGVVENVAGGDLGYLTPYAAVYEIWADPVHGRTMTGYEAGSIGAGVANDGVTAYYTLEVRPAGRETPESGAGLITPIPLVTLVLSTPHPDGSIVHVVGYGQTLWAIALAYGIRMDQIRAWNNLEAGATDIYAGQYLLVLPANLAAATPTLPLPTEPETQGVMVSDMSEIVEVTLTPATSENTPTVSELALVSLADAETQNETLAASRDSLTEARLLAPYLAAGCILIGGALLLMLRKGKKPF